MMQKGESRGAGELLFYSGKLPTGEMFKILQSCYYNVSRPQNTLHAKPKRMFPRHLDKQGLLSGSYIHNNPCNHCEKNYL